MSSPYYCNISASRSFSSEVEAVDMCGARPLWLPNCTNDLVRTRGGGHGDSMHNVAQFSSEEKGTGEIIQAYQGIALMWVYAPTSTCKKCL